MPTDPSTHVWLIDLRPPKGEPFPWEEHLQHLITHHAVAQVLSVTPLRLPEEGPLDCHTHLLVIARSCSY